MKLTRSDIASQVLVDRWQRVPRSGIIRNLKRTMKKDWSRKVIALVDYVIKHKKMPEETPTVADAKMKVIDALTKGLSLRKNGKRWIWKGRFADLGAAKRKQKEIARRLVRYGFRYARTRGDVGFWTDGYEYRRVRGVDLSAGISLNERRKPLTLTIDVESVRDFYERIT